MGRDYDVLLHAFKDTKEQLRIVSGNRNLQGEKIPENTQKMIEIPYASLRNVYRDAKFVVLPIRNYQSLSGLTVLLESFAMGKAVIATKCWGTEDYIIDGQTGFFVRAGNKDELKDRISYLLRNPEVSELIGKNARQYVERECALGVYARKLLTLLKEACELPE
jgi:glycosyltransferase involved in cell wall biosynthesis